MSNSTVIGPNQQFEKASEIECAIWEQLWTVNDPELPVSIVDLGLIYDVSVEHRKAEIAMTLTYSGCPARDMIVGEAEKAVESLDAIESTKINIVYSPPWTIDRITEAGRNALSEYGLAVPDSSPTSEQT
jgi:phenylacetate-CoA oxygenase PaaJ subunit